MPTSRSALRSLSATFGDIGRGQTMLAIYRRWKEENPSGDLFDFDHWCRTHARVSPSEVMEEEEYDQLLLEGIDGDQVYRDFVSSGLEAGP